MQNIFQHSAFLHFLISIRILYCGTVVLAGTVSTVTTIVSLDPLELSTAGVVQDIAIMHNKSKIIKTLKEFLICSPLLKC